MAITRPYSANEYLKNWANISTFSDLDGYKLSPSVNHSTSDIETNHYRITVTWTGGTVSARVKGNSTSTFSNTSWSPWSTLTSGVESIISRNNTNTKYWWLELDIQGGATITNIDVYYYSANTVWGYDTPRASITFDGVTYPYDIMYPKDYDSNNPTTYPLVVTIPGGGETGLSSVTLSQHLFGSYFDSHKCFAINCASPGGAINVSSLLNPELYIGPNYYPFKDGPLYGEGVPYWHISVDAYNEYGYMAAAICQIIQNLIANADIKIDTDRIYITGYSGGGYGTWEMLKKGRDIFAAGVAGAGWSIWGPYENVYLSGVSEAYEYRLKQELERYKHIPVLGFSGVDDNMKYITKFTVDNMNAIGGDAYYIESPSPYNKHVDAAGPGGFDLIWAVDESWIRDVLDGDIIIDWLFAQTKNPCPPDPHPSYDYINPPVVAQRQFDEYPFSNIEVYLDGIDNSNNNYINATVEYSMSDLTATNGIDYSATSGSIDITGSEFITPTILLNNQKTFKIILSNAAASYPDKTLPVLNYYETYNFITVATLSMPVESLNGGYVYSFDALENLITGTPTTGNKYYYVYAYAGDVLHFNFDLAFPGTLNEYLFYSGTPYSTNDWEKQWANIFSTPVITPNTESMGQATHNIVETGYNYFRLKSYFSPTQASVTDSLLFSRILSPGATLQLSDTDVPRIIFTASTGESATLVVNDTEIVVANIGGNLIWDYMGPMQTTINASNPIAVVSSGTLKYTVTLLDTMVFSISTTVVPTQTTYILPSAYRPNIVRYMPPKKSSSSSSSNI